MAGRLVAGGLCWPRLGDGLAREGWIVAPGAWKWPAGVVRAARHGLGLLPGVSGAEVIAAGVTAVVRRRVLWPTGGWRPAG